MLEDLISGSEYHVLDNSSLDPFIFSSKIVSLVLAFAIAVYAYQFYKIYHSLVLFGIILGFGFMALSDVFMVLASPALNDPTLFNLFFWFRLLATAYGFTFLALSYHHTRKDRETNTPILKISILSIIPVFAMLTITWFSNNPSLPPFSSYDEYFRTYSICALGYVFIKSFQYSVSHVRKDFVYLPIAYGILWIGQFSLLFFALDKSLSSVVAAFVAKDVGLAIFAIMMYWISKGKPSLNVGIKTPDEV